VADRPDEPRSLGRAGSAADLRQTGYPEVPIDFRIDTPEGAETGHFAIMK
jgi:hypothetical protein